MWQVKGSALPMAIVEAAPISGKGTAGGATNKPTVADQMFCSGKKKERFLLSMYQCFGAIASHIHCPRSHRIAMSYEQNHQNILKQSKLM
jgi:hypothetical protein